MSIAENLRTIREQRGLQQKQVALEIGIGTTTNSSDIDHPIPI
jgi:transcriptional regulator with XRE-family HTH domain